MSKNKMAYYLRIDTQTKNKVDLSNLIQAMIKYQGIKSNSPSMGIKNPKNKHVKQVAVQQINKQQSIKNYHKKLKIFETKLHRQKVARKDNFNYRIVQEEILLKVILLQVITLKQSQALTQTALKLKIKM